MFNIGPLELIVVLIIALLVLGPQRLPDAARSVGRGIREFRSAMNMDHDDQDDWELEPPASPQAEPVKTPEQAAAAAPVPEHAKAAPAGAAKPTDPAQPPTSS